MTSAKWSDAPFAVWIREGLDAKNQGKSWLIDEIAKRRKIGRETAETNVYRWTAKDTIPEGENLDVLIKLFGQPPSLAEAEMYRVQGERIAALEETQGKLMRLAVAVGKDRQSLIAEVRELLRQTGDSR